MARFTATHGSRFGMVVALSLAAGAFAWYTHAAAPASSHRPLPRAPARGAVGALANADGAGQALDVGPDCGAALAGAVAVDHAPQPAADLDEEDFARSTKALWRASGSPAEPGERAAFVRAARDDWNASTPREVSPEVERARLLKAGRGGPPRRFEGDAGSLR